jgi:potassium-transporting ATPase potassium-binding subunit
MTGNAVAQVTLYFALLLLLAKPLGAFVARVYSGEKTFLDRIVGPVERLTYRLSGVAHEAEMTWKAYTGAFLTFNLLGFVAVFAILRLQAFLPWNPRGLGGLSPDLAFNTAASFATNTNWQSYSGETTLSYFSQMLALTVQNFVSAAAGMAVLAAFARGVARRSGKTLGNFWVDLVRSTLYVLLPLSVVLAIALVSQGVVQTLRPSATVTLLQPTHDASGAAVTEQTLALGPAASQIAIKQVGTNGGGFFNVNSAHPFENPTALSNLLEMLAILLLAAALCHSFGRLVGDVRQGRALLAAMTLALALFVVLCVGAEQRGNPALGRLGVDQRATALQPGGNMEGKEARFGIVDSALWASATTAASNGSVNAMHDSFTPLGGLAPLVLMQFGEVIFGGVGSGLYGMLIFAIVAVFIAGLMVGRTPEYLGKKIEAFEIKMASVALLAPALCVLVGTAAAVATEAGRAAVLNPGPHGFSEVLYAFSSTGNNNGSAFGGLSANNPFYNATLGIAMLVSRYFVAIPALALAGSLVRKKVVAPGPGTFPTHTPLFVILLLGIVVLVGALTFLPALALGPIVEHLLLYR